MRVRLIPRRQAGAMVLLLAVLTPLVGCSRSASQVSPASETAISSEAPASTATPRPSTASPAVASPAEQLTPSATLEPIPSGLPADIEHAMRQRQLFGLRSDLAWVQQVAADPRAQMEALDFPMLPEEEAEFGSRQRAYEAAVEVIQRYAASHVDQFGGVYIDQPNHVVVTLWTDDPEGHLADLNKLGAVAKPIVARQVRWSERELRAVQDQVDWDWFSEVDAKGEGVGADIVRNVVEIDISSANPDAPRHIVEHYIDALGIPPDMLVVTSDGTGAALLPFGTVRGVVTLADGSEPGYNNLMVDGRGAGPGSCGGGDIGYGVGADGRFRIPCQVGEYTMVIEAPLPRDGGWVVVGRADVTVRADETVKVRIRLDRGADVRG